MGRGAAVDALWLVKREASVVQGPWAFMSCPKAMGIHVLPKGPTTQIEQGPSTVPVLAVQSHTPWSKPLMSTACSLPIEGASTVAQIFFGWLKPSGIMSSPAPLDDVGSLG